MTTVKSDDMLEYCSIDDILGAGERRFFSTGYKRVGRRLGDITAGVDDQGRAAVAATASLSYPVDWSKKSPDADLRPHVSSVDAMLFGIVLSELLLSHHHALDADQRRRMWLRGIGIRAGSAPVEDLTGFRVSASARGSRPAPGSPTRHSTSVECLVGTIKVRCEIEHGTSARRAVAGRYAAPSDLLGADATRYYGDGFSRREHLIEHVRFTRDRAQVTADVSVLPGPAGEVPTQGLGGHYQPSLSAIDCMVTMAQLNQALLYLQDGVDRGDSNTLWLRKFTLKAARPDQPFDGPFPVSARTVRSDLVDYANGSWRTFTMAGEFRGFSGHTLLAHRLPTTEAQGE